MIGYAISETPQVVFEVKDDDGNVVYRDAITYPTMSALASDNKAERQAKFQQRYDAWLELKNNPPQVEPEFPVAPEDE